MLVLDRPCRSLAVASSPRITRSVQSDRHRPQPWSPGNTQANLRLFGATSLWFRSSLIPEQHLKRQILNRKPKLSAVRFQILQRLHLIALQTDALNPSAIITHFRIATRANRHSDTEPSEPRLVRPREKHVLAVSLASAFQIPP